MDPSFLPLFGLLVGMLIGLTGVGVGAILAPILLILFQLEIITVIAIDLAFSCITKSFSAVFHIRKKTIDWNIAKKLWMGSLPASLVVILFINKNPILVSGVITIALSCLIFVSGLILIFKNKIIKFLHNFFRFIKAKEDENNLITTFFGSFIGVSVSATSVGAGAIGTAILTILYPTKLNSYRLVGTDLMHAIPVSLIAGLTYFSFGTLDLSVLGALLIGSIPGVVIGSRVIFNFPQYFLRTIIGFALIISSIFLILF